MHRRGRIVVVKTQTHATTTSSGGDPVVVWSVIIKIECIVRFTEVTLTAATSTTVIGSNKRARISILVVVVIGWLE